MEEHNINKYKDAFSYMDWNPGCYCCIAANLLTQTWKTTFQSHCDFLDIKPILTVYRDREKEALVFLKCMTTCMICPTHVQMNQTLLVITMAKPTSAFFRAGPSLVPSPVTATTCLCSMILLSMMPEHKKTKNRPFSVCLCCWVCVCACVHALLTFDQCVFVGGWWPSQNTQLGPDFVNALLFNLRRRTDGERPKEERVINLNSSLLSLDVTVSRV